MRRQDLITTMHFMNLVNLDKYNLATHYNVHILHILIIHSGREKVLELFEAKTTGEDE